MAISPVSTNVSTQVPPIRPEQVRPSETSAVRAAERDTENNANAPQPVTPTKATLNSNGQLIGTLINVTA